MSPSVLLAHGFAAPIETVPVLLSLIATLLLPFVAVTVYFFWPPRRSDPDHVGAGKAVSSMHDELWQLIQEVERRQFPAPTVPDSRVT